jgi:hypothetical protein
VEDRLYKNYLDLFFLIRIFLGFQFELDEWKFYPPKIGIATSVFLFYNLFIYEQFYEEKKGFCY